MPYWRLFYHLTWSTRNRTPLITVDIEAKLHGYIAGKATSLEAIVYAVNGTEDHIHLVTSIPPKLSIAEFVGRIKGSSSHHVNHLPGRSEKTFSWQRGYGVLSFGGKQLAWVVKYVRRQKEHHQQNTTVALLECATEEEDSPVISVINEPPDDQSSG